MALQHLRSSTAHKRPSPTSMVDGQLAINTEAGSPGLFFKDSNSALVKVGPVHVGTAAPNATPGSGGQTGNSTGELWLDTSLTPNELKTYNGTAWVSATGAEIAVSKLADGSARQLLQTDAAGTGVEWASNIDIPGTLDVTSTTTLDSTLTVAGATTINNTAVISANNSSGTAALRITQAGTANALVVEDEASDTTPFTVSATGDTTIGGTLSVPLGTAALPTIYPGTDTNTGFWFPAADTIAASTGGSERACLDSSGRLLVGTSSAVTTASGTSLLQSTATLVFTGANRNADTNPAVVTLAKNRNGTIVNSGDGLGRIQFEGFDGVNYFRGAQIVSEVDGTLGQAATTTVNGTQYRILTTGTTDFTLIGAANSNPGTVFTATGAGTGTGTVILTAGDMPGRLVFSTTADGASSPTERLRITSAGNVGIGTQSPATLLHLSSATGSASPTPTELRIATTSNAADWSTTNPWGRISFFSADSTDGGAKITAAIDAVAAGSTGGTSNLDFKFAEAGTGTLTSRLFIDAVGRVGIRTTTPVQALDVIGNANIGSPTGAAFINVGPEATENRFAYIDLIGDTTYSDYGLRVIRGDEGANANSALVHRGTGDLRIAAQDAGSLSFVTLNLDRARIDSSGRLLVGTTSTNGRLHVSGTQSDTSLSTTKSHYIATGSGTFTDTSAAGTVTHGTINSFDNPTIAATNSQTYTNASTVYIDGAPTQGTNVTITNAFSLFVAAGASRFGGSVLTNSSSAGIGYATGAGSAQTQASSRTTGVTLNAVCGAITLVSAAGSTSWQSFTVTNSAVAATDTVIVNQKSGTDLYEINVTNVGAGSFQLTYRTTGGTTTEQPVFNFSVIKAVAA